MSHIATDNQRCRDVAYRVVMDESFFGRMSVYQQGRCIAEIAAEIADAANGALDHFRSNLGAFDADPD